MARKVIDNSGNSVDATNLSNINDNFMDLYANGNGLGSGKTTLATLTDVSVTEGSGIDGYKLTWNNSLGKWVAIAPKTVNTLTSSALTTAAQAAASISVTDAGVSSSSIVLVSINNGTNSAGIPTLGVVAPGTGSFTVTVFNADAAAAFNGTIIINYEIAG